MAKFIQTIHDRLQLALKKGLSAYYSPTKVDSEVHAESMNLWLKYAPLYAKDNEIALSLKPFEKIEAISGLSGSAAEGSKAVTACHLYPIAAVIAGNKEVKIRTIAEYNYLFTHPTKGPDAGHPICKFVNNMIFVAPSTDLSVTYLSKPVKPKYAYTVGAGDQYIYDDDNSTDIEWDERFHDAIMNRVLSNLGLSLREQQVIQFGMIEKQTEGK